jgi:hypothetical protein
MPKIAHENDAYFCHKQSALGNRKSAILLQFFPLLMAWIRGHTADHVVKRLEPLGTKEVTGLQASHPVLANHKSLFVGIQFLIPDCQLGERYQYCGGNTMFPVFIFKPHVENLKIPAIYFENSIIGGDILERVQPEFFFSEVSGRDVFRGRRILRLFSPKNFIENAHLFNSFIE